MTLTRRAGAALRFAIFGTAFVCAAVLPSPVAAETGAEAWLRYSALSPQAAKTYERLPANTVSLGDSLVLKTAQQELLRGASQMLGRTLRVRTLRVKTSSSPENAIVLGKLIELQALFPDLHPPQVLRADGYWLKSTKSHGSECLVVTASTDRGVLYGVFALLSKIARGESLAAIDITAIDEVQQPYAPIRWVNQWDNLDGRIERGYGGPSIFFADGSVRSDLTRAGQYARLLASIGINGCTINNVNAAPRILEDSFIAQVSRIADVFRPWGVQLSLSVDLSSPKVIGSLDTFDPLDPRVAEWWRKKVDEIYRQHPGLRRLRRQSRFRGTPRPVDLWQNPRRCGQRDRARTQAAWRRGVLSRFCLQPSSRLARPEERSRQSGLRQFSSAGWRLRRQRHHSDQEWADRLPGT